MPNIDRLHALAAHIERLPDEEFSMEDYRHECGTPSCIGGWAVYLYGDWDNKSQRMGTTAAQLLDLSNQEYNTLFLMIGAYESTGIGLCSATRQDAARALRNLAAGVPTAEIWGPAHE